MLLGCKALIQAQGISSASVGTSTGLDGLAGLHAARYLWFRPTVYSAVLTPCSPEHPRLHLAYAEMSHHPAILA